MKLVSQVQAVFEPGGVLSQAEAHFVPRRGQTDMAVAVAEAIEGSYALVVEASTGVGKTFSYLVPALLSGDRVLISTATKALQDQLFAKDLPRLVRALALPVRTALLKGRASYLCLHRMDIARHDGGIVSPALTRGLARIERWSTSTQTGDLAEMDGLDERSPLIPLVTSTRENCLGTSCPRFKPCHVNLARREALGADVVVINHHLFFADLAVRESGVAELLPSVRVAIFDEAHQLNETGVQFLGSNLTTGQLLDFSRDVLAAGLRFARGLADWQQLAEDVDRVARDLRLSAGRQFPGTKLRWTDRAPEGLAVDEWLEALDAVREACARATKVLDTVSEIAADFIRLSERGALLVTRVELFQKPCEPGSVRWLDVGAQLRLIESPLNIEKVMQSRVLGSAEGSAKSWIFTSATLGDDEKLSWFSDPCGLKDARVLRVGSPFDYSTQAALYVPADFPKPSDPSHPAMVASSATRWIRRLQGRTMVLTTTLKALRIIGDALVEAFGQSEGVEVLVQGTMPKRALVDRFRRGASGGDSACVLVASASFWEGLDFPGEALQMVIIDKLPFPPPNDPLVEARSKMIESQGKSAFNHYFLPEAAVALKQGAGRLIRRETDQGVLVVCDSRLVSMGYGRRLLKALPEMGRIESEDELLMRLDGLLKICTRDCSEA